MSRLGSNPLENRGKNLHYEVQKEIKKEEIIKNFGRMGHLSKKLIDNIDFTDKSYINRIYSSETELELEDIKESIREIGLINLVYVQEREDKKFRIISGLRRLGACKILFDIGEEVKAKDRVIIFENTTPIDYLDKISVDENTKRKDLTIMEQSYKFNREANKKNKSIEDILEEYSISKKNFYRIKNAIYLPEEIRSIIEELGADKAETLYKIVREKNYKPSIQNLVDNYRYLTREELRQELKKLKSKDEKELCEINYKRSGAIVNINRSIDDNLRKFLEQIKQKIDNEDYHF